MPTSSSRAAFKLVGGSSFSHKKAQKAQMIKDARNIFLCLMCLFAAFVPTSAQPAKQLVDDGVAAFDRGDVASARNAFEKALSLKQDEVTAHTYLGIIADQAGDLKGAEQHFAAAVKADPNRASSRNNYGAILMRTGRSKLAAVEFEQSLKLDPDQPNALVNLAQIRFAADDLRASLALFERAFTIKPDVDIARALVVITLRLKDYPAAIPDAPK
jgi:Flp pilus assembly protein TadD